MTSPKFLRHQAFETMTLAPRVRQCSPAQVCVHRASGLSTPLSFGLSAVEGHKPTTRKPCQRPPHRHRHAGPFNPHANPKGRVGGEAQPVPRARRLACAREGIGSGSSTSKIGGKERKSS